jgi:hypothetical protein
MHALVIVLELLVCQGNVKTLSYTVKIKLRNLKESGAKSYMNIAEGAMSEKMFFLQTGPITINPRQNFFVKKTKFEYHRKILLIEGNAKCRHLK